MNDGTLSILIIEPYFGGSHRSFLSGLSNLPFRFEHMTLPARKWKWRMRLAAPFLADRLRDTCSRFDRILCSTFLDVAAFRGMAPQWVRDVPLLTYFHENQFEYPVQAKDERDLHFALTNLTTALASDSIAFNSQYNLRSFLSGTGKLLRHAGDIKLEGIRNVIRAKSEVIPPGIDFTEIDGADEAGAHREPVILWNHRWEHDKNPELFFETLFRLEREGIDFKLVVLGQSFERRPSMFSEAKKRLSHRILQFGYVKSRREYARWLKQCTLVVSTAFHEFFGISVAEAVRAGCRPLLPNRLSYPELFPGQFLYNEGSFAERLRAELKKNKRLTRSDAVKLTNAFSWTALSPRYEKWLSQAGSYKKE